MRLGPLLWNTAGMAQAVNSSGVASASFWSNTGSDSQDVHGSNQDTDVMAQNLHQYLVHLSGVRLGPDFIMWKVVSTLLRLW